MKICIHLHINFSGIGGSMLMTASFYILPHYWEKRRGMATAIAMAGICLGKFIAPLIIVHLQNKYSFVGCALIIGAIQLNGLPASSLYHPLEWHSEDKSISFRKIILCSKFNKSIKNNNRADVS